MKIIKNEGEKKSTAILKLPVQLRPSGAKKNPSLVHEHSNDPSVFVQRSLQPPLSEVHSFTSE